LFFLKVENFFILLIKNRWLFLYKIFEVAEIKLSIGKSDKNDIVINNPFIADKHLELFVDNHSKVYLTDLKSSSGTFVNDKKLVGFIELKSGDEVFIGNGHYLDWENIIAAYQNKSKNTNDYIKKKPQIQQIDNRSFIRKNMDVIVIYAMILFFLMILGLIF